MEKTAHSGIPEGTDLNRIDRPIRFLLCLTDGEDGSFGDPRKSRLELDRLHRSGSSLCWGKDESVDDQIKIVDLVNSIGSPTRFPPEMIGLHSGPNKPVLRLRRLLHPRQSSGSTPRRQTERGITWNDHSLVMAWIRQNGESS